MTQSPSPGSSNLTLRDLEKYVFTTTYEDRVYDCVDLVVQVQREVYGRLLDTPGAADRSAGVRGHARLLRESLVTYLEKTDDPQNGDVVLVWETTPFGKPPYNRRWHIGVFHRHYGEPWMLHAANAKAGTRLQRLDDVLRAGNHFEAYLAWK